MTTASFIPSAAIATASLGFPRIGPQRELKQALEAFWSGKTDAAAFTRNVHAIRAARWTRQKHHGVAVVPSNDFSWYDHVLDTCCLVGAVPDRFGHGGGPVDLRTYFRMARGGRGGDTVAALEMTKWFDTNYHYLVPELSAATRFAADASKPVEEFRAALAMGITTRPVLIGPVTFLRLAKRTDGGDPLALLPALLTAYVSVLRALADAGATWLQLDEPCLVSDLDADWCAAYRTAYDALASAEPRLRLLLATYFGPVDEHLPLLASLPVHGLHVDLVRGPDQLTAVLDAWPAERLLSLGVIDGRNIWRADLDHALVPVQRALARRRSGPLQVAPSCSLLHVPVDLAEETAIAAAVQPWLAFATQKLDELHLVATGANDPRSIAQALDDARRARHARLTSPLVQVPAVRARADAVQAADCQRAQPFAVRTTRQHQQLRLPPFPTTTIGSFPQTAEVRRQRAAFKAGSLAPAAYEAFLREETARCVRFQEDIGLDVLVHGEFERTDMVEHFGELLSGYVITGNGWVQSYGSRCVKPPIIVGDVHRPQPMTVAWARYAQSCSKRPVKGMLTGPVTMLQWSFVRDDLPRAQVCRQLALALRDEIRDLEAAGIAVIQVDEPAFREGLPLRRAAWDDYLRWAVDAFRLATSHVADHTQIHTHMCYSEFNDIIGAIADLDADVISIETARSRMELLDAFARFAYPNEIGPGVYDIHSPAVPDVEQMAALLTRAARVLPAERLWVNPDCGLKTRSWDEVRPALINLVAAANAARGTMAASHASTGAGSDTGGGR
jgi:5-methyltetrahydropteroyltriglutamate--homocysteine methyltransferase